MVYAFEDVDMKIAMIGQKAIPSRSGGIEVHVEELSKRMANMGHDVMVYCRESHIDLAAGIVPGVKTKVIPYINTKHLEAFSHSFFSMLHALFDGAEVFHFHALGPAVFALLPHLLRRKVVVTVHGLDWQRDKWGGFAMKFLKFGEYASVRFADRTISVSESLVPYYSEKYKNAIYFIPNGVKKAEYVPVRVIEEKHGLKKDEYILFLARIVPEKGLHYLIDAFRSIDTSKKLVIAGGSSHSDDYMESLIRQASDDERMIFTGFVKGRELEELYANCYAYVLPSDVEGMPISLLEAMSSGACCLVSDIPENLSVIKKYGIHFKKSNVEDLKDKLKFLLSNDLLRIEMGIKAKQYVNDAYNWDTVAKQTLAVYESI